MIKPIILKQARPETIIKNYSMNRPLSVNITTRTKTFYTNNPHVDLFWTYLKTYYTHMDIHLILKYGNNVW